MIGAGNRLPWRLPDDLKRFRALTTGHAVIMGRKTWESLPRALPDRQNIVVTRAARYRARRRRGRGSFDDALALVRLPAPVFCIGGGELYRAALPLATTLLPDRDRRATSPATRRFPPFDRATGARPRARAHRERGPDGFAYAFVTYERRDAGGAAVPL